MQTISTEYFGPTNSKGSRIKATASGGKSKTIPYPHELNQEDAHRRAATTLAESLNWSGRMIQGSTKKGYVFVFDPLHS